MITAHETPWSVRVGGAPGFGATPTSRWARAVPDVRARTPATSATRARIRPRPIGRLPGGEAARDFVGELVEVLVHEGLADLVDVDLAAGGFLEVEDEVDHVEAVGQERLRRLRAEGGQDLGRLLALEVGPHAFEDGLAIHAHFTRRTRP